MFTLTDQHTAELQETLLGWFAAVARPLPWRSHRTLYGTWIAEIMLQQTTVAVVESYWRRFLDRFPDVTALAAADEQEVLALWSGLGYYRRARHLHAAARLLAAQGQGLPLNREGWAALPGIGPYAAGAIASQGLGEVVPAVDANARRVLTRWLVDDPAQLPHLAPRALAAAAASLVPAGRPGDWNEAVMELGALICRARSAACGDCPALHLCRAGLAGRPDEIPSPARPLQTAPVLAAMLVVRRRGRLFLTRPGVAPCLEFSGETRPVRDDFADLHQGLWGLPQTAWVEPGEAAGDVRLASVLAEALGEGGRAHQSLGQEGVNLVGEFRHAITRFRLRVLVYQLDLGGNAEGEMGVNGVDFPAADDYPRTKEIFSYLRNETEIGCFVSGFGELPLSSLARKALATVGGNQG